MASIFSNTTSSRPRPKTHVSIGTLPPFIDPKQPPTKKSPWRQILDTPFISSITITLPTSLYTTIQPHICQLTPLANNPNPTSTTTSSTSPTTTSPSHPPSLPPKYAKVILTLLEILTPPLFTAYIKPPGSNILLLSSGSPATSPWHCHIHSGQLHLEMSRELYERCGLQGKPADRNSGARKHGKDRWAVDVDLRAPAMVGGRKGFERLVRAAREVLGEGLVWLFRDLREQEGKQVRGQRVGDVGADGNGDGEEVIRQHHPTIVTMNPTITETKDVLVPSILTHPTHYNQQHNDNNQPTQTRYPPPLNSTSTPIPSSTHQQAGAAAASAAAAVAEEEYHQSLLEWLSLLHLPSSQILNPSKSHPRTDTYISRYAVPDADTATLMDVTVVTWEGLLDSAWCTRLLVDLVRASRVVGRGEDGSGSGSDIGSVDGDGWAAVTIKVHRTKALGQENGCVVFLRRDGHGAMSGKESGGNEGKDEIDVDVPDSKRNEDVMETDAKQPEEVSASASASTSRSVPGGFKHFTCFQFVDTVVQ